MGDISVTAVEIFLKEKRTVGFCIKKKKKQQNYNLLEIIISLLPIGCFGTKSFIILSNFFLMRLSFSGVLSGESFGCIQRCCRKQRKPKLIVI